MTLNEAILTLADFYGIEALVDAGTGEVHAEAMHTVLPDETPKEVWDAWAVLLTRVIDRYT